MQPTPQPTAEPGDSAAENAASTDDNSTGIDGPDDSADPESTPAALDARRPPTEQPAPADSAPFPLGGVVGAAAGGGAVFLATAVAWAAMAAATFVVTASFCPAWQIFSVVLPLLLVAVGSTGPVIAGGAGPLAVGAGAYFGASDEPMRTRTQLAAGAAPGCALGGAAVCGTLTGGTLVGVSLLFGGPFAGGSAFTIYTLLLGGLLGASSWAAALFAPPVAIAGIAAQAVNVSLYPTPPQDAVDDSAQSF